MSLMEDNSDKKAPPFSVEGNIMDSVRQLHFPAEFRIVSPFLLLDREKETGGDDKQQPPSSPVDMPEDSAQEKNVASYKLVAELATCLWYLKTKYFKREWEDDTNDDEEPRVRRALGRLDKGIDALKENGIEVQDPTNKRYPQGGEGMMRPIQFQPTAGLSFEMVTETVVPIIYFAERLIQRGEVFVGVPQEKPEHAMEQATDTIMTSDDGKTISTELEIQTADASTNAVSDCNSSGKEMDAANHSEENLTPGYTDANEIKKQDLFEIENLKAKEDGSNSSSSHDEKEADPERTKENSKTDTGQHNLKDILLKPYVKEGA